MAEIVMLTYALDIFAFLAAFFEIPAYYVVLGQTIKFSAEAFYNLIFNNNIFSMIAQIFAEFQMISALSLYSYYSIEEGKSLWDFKPSDYSEYGWVHGYV